MKEKLRSKPVRLWLIAAALCFLLALGFKFALIGYGMMSLLFAGVGLLILLFLFLPRKLRIMLTALLVIGVLVFGAAELPVLLAAGGTPDMDADYIIVLGAGVNGSSPSLSMVNRLTAARDYLAANPDCIAVVSGGQGPGENITEAEAMFRWLTAQGISSERLLLEDKATSTLENLRYSLALIPDAEHAAIAVVSSEYHLCRAQRMAELLGYSVGGIPGHTSYPVLKLNYFLREALGMIHLTVFGI